MEEYIKLYTNSSKETRIKYRLEEICKNTTIYISVAFFNNIEFIKKSLNNNCEIFLIVRLDFGTDPNALLEIENMNNPNIHIRYYACRNFHPKFYIIDNVCAIVGSSNLTNSGVSSNLEVNIEISCENTIYEELKREYWLEWDCARVLTKEKILDFKNKYDSHNNIPDSNSIFFSEKDLVLTPNIIDDNKKERKNESIKRFEKDYQLYISAFSKLKNIYCKVSNERKYDDKVPLRIEIDRFLSWIKDEKYKGEEYLNIKKKNETAIENDVKYLKDEFIQFKTNEYYNTTYERYVEIKNKLGNKEAIHNQNKKELLEVLLLINAIYDQLRFFPGGMETLKQEFLLKNDETKIKNTLTYLLEGKENFIERIYNIVNPSTYKLEVLGDSSIKELYGYINNDDIPTCNHRMLHSMQWLGFGKL